MITSHFSRVALLSTIITFFASFIMFVVSIILARSLELEVFGQYIIIRTIIILLPFTIYLGIGNALIRIHKTLDIFNHNWQNIFNKGIIISIPICIPVALLLYQIYDFSILQTFSIIISCIIMGRVMLSSAILHLSEKYVYGQLIKNIWRVVYILLLLGLIVFNIEFNLNRLILFLLISMLLSFLISFYIEKNISKGKKPLKYSFILSEGFIFFLLGMSDLLLSQIDKFLIGYNLGFIEVGRYTAVSILPFTIFSITASSIGLITMPYLINNKNSINELSKFIYVGCFLVIPLFIYLFFNVFGVKLVHYIYNFKFVNIDSLFFYCNILGCIQYLQVLCYFLIGATIKKDKIRKITILNYLIIILLLPLYYNLTITFGIIGSVISFILLWLARLFVSLFYLYMNRFANFTEA